MAFRNLILCYQAFYHRRMMRMIFDLPYAQISIRNSGAWGGVFFIKAVLKYFITLTRKYIAWEIFFSIAGVFYKILQNYSAQLLQKQSSGGVL